MVFNIAFFADTHIGYRAKVRNNSRGINIRVQDGYDALKEIVDQIIKSDGKEKIDAVVIAGDLFHTSHPSIRDITTAQWYLRQLAKHGIPVYILAGNHDTNDIRAELASVAAIEDPDRKIFVVHEPYKAFELNDQILLHMVSHHGLGEGHAPEIKAVEGKINIFSTHGSALDPKNRTLMRTVDSPREQFIPVELLLDEVFVAKLLGHYHSRYAVGGELLNAWYSGSTIRRGFSDAPGPRGWILVSIDDNGNPTWTPKDIHQRSQFDLDVIDADGLNASEVMTLLEQNLTRTMDTDDEPIARQRIINVNKGIREGLDNERINELTKHLLMWKLEKLRPEESEELEDENKKKNKASLSNKQSINVVDSFEGWAKEQGKSVPEEYREVVVKDAEDYIKIAHAATLASEH